MYSKASRHKYKQASTLNTPTELTGTRWYTSEHMTFEKVNVVAFTKLPGALQCSVYTVDSNDYRQYK